MLSVIQSRDCLFQGCSKSSGTFIEHLSGRRTSNLVLRSLAWSRWSLWPFTVFIRVLIMNPSSRAILDSVGFGPSILTLIFFRTEWYESYFMTHTMCLSILTKGCFSLWISITIIISCKDSSPLQSFGSRSELICLSSLISVLYVKLIQIGEPSFIISEQSLICRTVKRPLIDKWTICLF